MPKKIGDPSEEMIERIERICFAWMEWRRGPLADCSLGALSLLFEFLVAANRGDQSRGYIHDSSGKRLDDPLSLARELEKNGAINLIEWEEGVDPITFEGYADELTRKGFLAKTEDGGWYSPQIVNGEI